MKRSIIVYGLILLAGLYSCSREFSARPKPYTSEFHLAAPSSSILLDKGYSLYCRAVDVEDSVVGGHLERRLVPHGRGNSSAKLVEIEYLFIPLHLGKIIYISTVADRDENRYSDSSFLGLDHPNAADFRVFLIGDLVDQHRFRFYFKDNKQTDNWTIEKSADRLRLVRIEQLRGREFEDVFEMRDALAYHADFYQIPNWRLCYLPKDETNTALVQQFTGNGIDFIKNGKKYELQMQFSQTLVTWKDKYVIYKPD